MAGVRKREWKTSKGTKKTCWEVSWCIDGKQYKRGGFKTRDEAHKAMPSLNKTFASDIKFNELAEDYLDRHCVIHCKESTQDLYRAYLKVNIAEIKNKKIKDITQRDILNLILRWKTDNLKNKTINNMLVFLQAVFNYGIEHKISCSNPCSGVKKLPSEAKEMKYLTEEELAKFLRKARKVTPDYYALFYTAAMTGMRRGELLALEWQDIDLKNGKININKQLYRKKITSTKTTKSTRKISIPDSLIAVLKEHKAKTKVLSKNVFVNAKGGHIHPYNMTERYFKKVLKEAGINEIRFHDLRHTYATILLMKNIPVKYVQTQLGHSNSRVTLDTYGHVLPSTDEKAVNILDEIKIEHVKNING